MLPDGYLRKNNCNVIEPPSLAGAQLVRSLQMRGSESLKCAPKKRKSLVRFPFLYVFLRFATGEGIQRNEWLFLLPLKALDTQEAAML
jgi:hypothetical protein